MAFCALLATAATAHAETKTGRAGKAAPRGGDPKGGSPKSRGQVSPQARAEAEQHFRRGQELYEAKRFDEAEKEFEAAYAQHPLPVFLFHLAEARRRAGRHQRALEAYELYLAENAPAAEGKKKDRGSVAYPPRDPDPRDVEALMSGLRRIIPEQFAKKGGEALAAQRFDEAAAEFEKAYRGDPRAEYLYGQGEAYLRAGQYERAQEVFRRYLEKHPSGIERGDVEKALEAMPRAMAQQHFERGQVALRAERLDEATAEFGKAVEGDPNPEYLFYLGDAQRRTAGRAEDAWKTLGRLEEELRAAEQSGNKTRARQIKEWVTTLRRGLGGRAVAAGPRAARASAPGAAVPPAGLGLVVGGGAVAVVGAALLGWAGTSASQYNDVYRQCFPNGSDRCSDPVLTERLRTLSGRVDTLQVAGPVLLGVGAAAAGVGGYLWGRWQSRRDKPRVMLVPAPLPGGASLGVSGVWP